MSSDFQASVGDTNVVEGTVDPSFAAVAQAFVDNFRELGDIGASVCVYHQGRPVVDLWGGSSTGADGDQYATDALQVAFSNTKSATSLCAFILEERGLLDFDAPVSAYWPEFAAEGKQELPVRFLLTHSAGLPNIDSALSLDDVLAWDPVVDALAAQRPYWEPGAAHGYHVLTFGWLVGELVRRVSGTSLGEFFATEVAGPLGLDFWIGLPQELEPRVVDLISANPPAHGHDKVSPRAAQMYQRMTLKGPMGPRAMSLNGAFDTFIQGCNPFNLRKFRAAQVPACSGVTNARSLARMHASMVGEVDGIRLLSPSGAKLASTSQVSGRDQILNMDNAYGMGFSAHSGYPELLGPGAFGYVGAGGSMGFSDPSNEIGFGYVMNQMRTGIIGDERASALLGALRRCL